MLNTARSPNSNFWLLQQLSIDFLEVRHVGSCSQLFGFSAELHSAGMGAKLVGDTCDIGHVVEPILIIIGLNYESFWFDILGQDFGFEAINFLSLCFVALFDGHMAFFVDNVIQIVVGWG